MRFTNKTVLAVLAQAYLALAQSNAFEVPDGGYSATAGQTLTLNWEPTTSGTVSLVLRSGASSNLDAGTYIAQNIENSGEYTWTIPADVTRGSDYAVEIVSDDDTSETNFTPYFVIDSTNTVASVTSQITLGASGTATPSSSGVISGTTTGSSASSEISSASSVASSVSASVSSVASSVSSAASASGSSMVSSVSSSVRSSASANSASSTPITVPSTGSAAMATAFPGLIGALALGALAL